MTCEGGFEVVDGPWCSGRSRDPNFEGPWTNWMSAAAADAATKDEEARIA